VSAVVQAEPQLGEAAALIQVIERAAANPQIDVEKMERLFALHERILARNAEMAFNEAMSECQKEMPQVERDAENQQTHSWYTRLETLSDAAVPVYTKHGFSLSFGEDDCPKEGHIRVICFCSHRSGHTRTYRGDIPIDIAGLKGNPNKTPTHAFGSTKSYGRRYLTLDIFNIVMKNEDDDGQEAGGPSPRPYDNGGWTANDTRRANKAAAELIQWVDDGRDVMEKWHEITPAGEEFVRAVWTSLPQSIKNYIKDEDQKRKAGK
jgi:hypothetical protein